MVRDHVWIAWLDVWGIFRYLQVMLSISTHCRIRHGTTGLTGWLWPSWVLLTSPSCLCCWKVRDPSSLSNTTETDWWCANSRCSCPFPDMTFINEGNPNYVDKLVNFEKMVRQQFFLLRGLVGFTFLKFSLCVSKMYGFFCSSCSAWLLRQSKLFEAAEASLTVSGRNDLTLTMTVSSFRLFFLQLDYLGMKHASPAEFPFPQLLPLRREAWQTGCSWKGLLCEYLPVSNSCLSMSENTLSKMYVNALIFPCFLTKTRTSPPLCGVPATSVTTFRTWRWLTTSASSPSCQER